MIIDRRAALYKMTSLLAALGVPRQGGAKAKQLEFSDHPPTQARHLRKIATEEAWIIPEVADALRTVVRRGGRSLDLPVLTSIYNPPPGAAPRFLPQLLDIDKLRLPEMD